MPVSVPPSHHTTTVCLGSHVRVTEGLRGHLVQSPRFADETGETHSCGHMEKILER